MPSGDAKADKCDKRCTGNKKDICGGHNRINIFMWGSGYDDSGLEPDAYHGASALGCFKDSKHDRVLDGDSKDDKHMSAEVRTSSTRFKLEVQLVFLASISCLLYDTYSLSCVPLDHRMEYVRTRRCILLRGPFGI